MTRAATTLDENALTEQFLATLREFPLRIELGFGFSVKGSAPTARFFVQRQTEKLRTKWEEFKPFLAGHPGEDRADLLNTIAMSYRQADGQTLSTLHILEEVTVGGNRCFHVWDRIQHDRRLLAVIYPEGLKVVDVSHVWTPIELEHLSLHMRQDAAAENLS